MILDADDARPLELHRDAARRHERGRGPPRADGVRARGRDDPDAEHGRGRRPAARAAPPDHPDRARAKGLRDRLGRHAPVRAVGGPAHRRAPALPRPDRALCGSSRARRSSSACTSTSASTTPTRRSTWPTGCACTSRCCSRCRPTRRSGAATTPAWPRPARRSSAPSRASGIPPDLRRLGGLRAGGSSSSSQTRVIEDYTYLWYDVRPHPRFGTVEVRVIDAQTRVDHTLGAGRADPGARQGAVRALRRGRASFAHYPLRDARREQVARGPPRARGRARRPAERRPRPDPGSRRRLYDRMREHAQDLGSAAELEGIKDLLERGNGAARQVVVYEANSDLREVMAEIVEATAA